jgi:ABC-type glycerol-3-phosphate transport system substrate-binding protein
MLLLAGSFFFGCVLAFAGGSKQSAASSTDGVVTINFYIASDLDLTADRHIAAFNALNNGIRVVKHVTPNDDYDDKLKVLVAGNAGEMDVIWIRTPAQTQQYIGNNALLDLSGFTAASGLDLSPIRNTSLKGAARDDKFYGLPTTDSCWMLFYNKDLFDARGLPYPIDITWDQYLDLAKSLTYTEGNRKYWGGVCPPWTMNLGASAAGEYLTAAEPMPLTRRYAEVLNRMYVTDHSHPDISEMSVGTFDINAVFSAGNVYMMIQGDWEFRLLDTPFTYAAAPLPVFPDVAKGSSVGQASYYCIPSSSSHAQEAYKFIEWCTTSAAGTTIYSELHDVPSYPTPEALEAYKKEVQVPGVDFRFSSRVSPEQGSEPYYAAVNDAFIQELQLYLLGEQDINKMFSNFYALRKEIAANN